ncbi:hypothetical protein PR202_ga02000 [Eleusine coracana subsp. coracana]|uniref:Uncharacterized protein n=1 Tax=Eleusine coracana subsp. coracana TaxID=191504 RepID=A0AAV5BJR3_ELECO|nr:hypothetical protein PR202_ga01313 [Eleusine coracana subsp. coracana]GJM86167.1 hypothetical protein PR202_ga02000 [Eleusine coracana subsp. coracana]
MDSAGRQAAARVREAARGRQVEFCCQADRWSTIARNLPGRTDNEIKNYWRTHFKKGKPSKNIERARARFLKQRREMQSQLLLQGQEQQQQLKQPDHHDAVVGEAAPAACPAQQHEDLQMMQDMDDLLYQLCPMSMSSCSSSYLLHGGSASAASEVSSEDQLEGGDTWGWGSLWNLDDVADDVHGGACGWDSSCPWLQDQGLAFY